MGHVAKKSVEKLTLRGKKALQEWPAYLKETVICGESCANTTFESKTNTKLPSAGETQGDEGGEGQGRLRFVPVIWECVSGEAVASVSVLTMEQVMLLRPEK